MKNKLLAILIICIIISTTIFTTTANTSDFYYEDKDTTISFSSSSELSYEQKQLIADRLVYGYTNDDQISTYSWCWLLGHDLVSDSVITIEHKVEVTTPRCIKRVYAVDTCSACDYMKEELISSFYIDCCPED